MKLEEKKGKIEQLVREIFEKMSIEKPSIIIESPVSFLSNKTLENTDEETFSVEVYTKNKFVIGKKGSTISALQHILRILIKKRYDEKISFNLDINDYRKNQMESLMDLVRDSVEKIEKTNRSITLNPMSSYERRLVHIEIAKNSNLKTESVGQGEDRSVMIKPSDA